jgi:hypothetical protein
MLSLNELVKLTLEEREAAFEAHAEEVTRPLYTTKPKPRENIGGMMVKMLIEAAEHERG